MRNKYMALAAILVSQVASAATLTFNVDVKNPLDRGRVDCPVVISLEPITDGMTVRRAIVMDGDAEVPCQIDDLNVDDVADEIAFVIDMGPKESKTLALTISDEGEQPVYEPRVWGTFLIRGQKAGQNYPIREVTVPGNVNFYNAVYGHGPMFESELVAYRVYFNQKQTLDPYGKFNKGLELEQTLFYPTAEHIANGSGDDVLMVGNSCGIGAFKGWDGQKATHIEPVKYRTERLIAAGPIRTIAEVEVDDWDYQGDELDMVNRYTLYAGHRDLQIDVDFGKPLGNQAFATGAQRIMGNETVSWSDHEGLTASWGRHWPVTDTVKYAKETIGIATYVPNKYIVAEVEDPDNYLYVVSAPDNSHMRYYTMFTSRKETYGYADSQSWFACLPSWREDLDNPLIVSVTPR